MWKNARKIVEEMFFHDEVELYRNDIVVNSIGEEVEEEQLVGLYKCNLQYSPATINESEGGKTMPQTLRISACKGFPLDYEYTYKIKVKHARINFDDKFWKVANWEEAQISTVINAIREVAV